MDGLLRRVPAREPKLATVGAKMADHLKDPGL